MGRQACRSCGATEIYYDTGTGVCVKCGNVVEESTIVAEVTFGEGSNGAAMAYGKNVPAGSSGAGGSGPESREQVIANGRAKIREVATSMKLGPYIEEMARRHFNLCVAINFIKGRSSLRVAAACLYISCREQKTSHMLIDFSDKLRINVFELGATYTKLVRSLHLEGKLPLVDPAHYIGRFAALLEFGADTQKVATDAARLVKRFDSDWLRVGRRPSGICGACLLLAARMNNFRRSVEEIVQVVKIADSTIKKRLEEFRNTPSGGLTVQDFRSLWLEEFADPPAFAKGKEKRLREGDDVQNEIGDEDENEEEIEVEADDSAPGRPVKRARTGADDEVDASNPATAIDASSHTASILPRLSSSEPHPNEEPPIIAEPSVPTNPLDEDEDFARITEEVQSHLKFGEGLFANGLGGPSSRSPSIAPDVSSSVPSNAVISNPFVATTATSSASIDPALESPDEAEAEQEVELVDNFDDIDDDEVNKYLCTAEEVTRKTRLWVEFNLQYLENLAAKGLDEQSGVEPRRKRSKPSKPKDSSNPTGATPAEATRNIMTKKKSISKRINYTNLNSLLGSDILALTAPSRPPPTPSESKSKSTRLRERSTSRNRDRNKNKRSASMAMSMTDEEFDGMLNGDDDDADGGNTSDTFRGLEKMSEDGSDWDRGAGYDSDEYQQEA